MHSTKNEIQVTYCNFPPHITTTKFYTCYKKETCCEQGCCTNGPYQIYQIWYYWLLFLIIFGIISGSSWLCKKPQSRTGRNMPGCSNGANNYALTRCNRRGCHRNFQSGNNESSSAIDRDNEIVLDRLYVSFRNRTLMGDPPSYSSILQVDNNNVQPKICPLYSYYGPPPTYSSMYKVTNEGVLQVLEGSGPQYPNGNSSQIATASEVLNTENVIQIQVHAEEGTSQPSGNDSHENAESSNNHAATEIEGNRPASMVLEKELKTDVTPEHV